MRVCSRSLSAMLPPFLFKSPAAVSGTVSFSANSVTGEESLVSEWFFPQFSVLFHLISAVIKCHYLF